jgi:hypothetical protein
MAKIITENALAKREESTGELATATAEALAQHEIQSAIVIARKFPRNEDQAFAKLMKACQRTSFAEDAEYSFPRGGATVSGPSVNVAREAARLWGNIRWGLYVLRDDEDTRQLRAWSWDMESNTKIEMEDQFAKLVYRKKEGWIRPDERDLRELTNRRGAILVRNCLLQLLPKDLIEDALSMCHQTIEKGVAQDPEGARKKTILAFGTLNITPEMLEKFLDHPLAQASPAEIAELRTIYASIRDGNSKWQEYVEAKEGASSEATVKKAPETGTLSINDLKAPATPASPQASGQPSAAAEMSATPAKCDANDMMDLETLAKDCGVKMKDVHGHITHTMGFAKPELLPKDRVAEVVRWIQAQKK